MSKQHHVHQLHQRARGGDLPHQQELEANRIRFLTKNVHTHQRGTDGGALAEAATHMDLASEDDPRGTVCRCVRDTNVITFTIDIAHQMSQDGAFCISRIYILLCLVVIENMSHWESLRWKMAFMSMCC